MSILITAAMNYQSSPTRHRGRHSLEARSMTDSPTLTYPELLHMATQTLERS